MNKLNKIAERISLSAGFISGIIMTLMMILIVANVLSRRFLNAPIFGSTEIVRYCMMIAAALALFNNEWHDGNPQMTFIIDMFKPKARALINAICCFAGAAGMIYVTYYMILQIAYKNKANVLTEDLKLPVWFFVMMLSIGTVLMVVCLIIKGLIHAKNVRTGARYHVEHAAIDGGEREEEVQE